MFKRLVVRFWPATLAVAVWMYWLQAWGCRASMRRVQAWMTDALR